MVLAIVDDGDDGIPVGRRQAAEQMLYVRMGLQVGRYLVRSTQVGTLLRKTVARREVEIAVHPVTGIGVVHHFVIQFQVAGAGSYQDHVAQVSAPAAVEFDERAECQPVGADHQETEAEVGEVEVAVYPYIFQNRKGQPGNDGEIHRVAEDLHHNLVGIYLAQMQDNAVPAGGHQVTEADDELQGPDGYPRRYRLLVGMAQQVEQQVVEEEISQFYNEYHKTVVTVSLHFHNRELSELKLGQKGNFGETSPPGALRGCLSQRRTGRHRRKHPSIIGQN